MTREEVIQVILGKIGNQPVLASTGKISREVFENSLTNHSELLIPGSMGCTTGIALGLALNQDKRINVIEGDGSMLMGFNSYVMIGYYGANTIHFILDNESHDSTGGQRTVSSVIDYEKTFYGLGFQYVEVIRNNLELDNFREASLGVSTPAMFVFKVKQGARDNLKRPDISFTEIKERFVKCLKS